MYGERGSWNMPGEGEREAACNSRACHQKKKEKKKSHGSTRKKTTTLI